MKRNNFFNFNPRLIERRLSPFGQQVFKTLIKQWNSDHDRNKNVPRPHPPPRHQYARNRVITFGEPQLANNTNDIAINGVSDVGDGLVDDRFEFPPDLNCQAALPPPALAAPPLSPPSRMVSPRFPAAPQDNVVFTSAELLSPKLAATININHNTRETLTHHDLLTDLTPEVPRNDLIKSFEPNHEHHTCRNILNDVYGSSDNEDFEINSSKAPKVNDYRDNVDWEDMFDSELFKEVNVPNDNVINMEPTSLNNANSFNIQFSKGNEIENRQGIFKKPQEIQNKSKRKSTTKVPDIDKNKKGKVELSKPKTSKKNSFRKEKYTKTVRNWLNDVDPNNPVEEESLNQDLHSELQRAQVTEQSKVKDVEKKSKEKPIKKVIQSQLANKGGIMKFGKPKTDGAEMKTINAEAGAEAAGPFNVEKSKERKKAKFVAPIKSQIPVKDIVYDVRIVDETTAVEHETNLCSIGDKEIVTILLYSNGFCQLNSQHTDDSCVPDAVMCCCDDVYYCFKGTGVKIAHIVSKVMKSNTIICYDGKALLMYLMSEMKLEFDTKLNIIDTKVAGSLLEPDEPPENLQRLQRLCDVSPQFTVATDCALQKAAWYSSLLRDCATKLHQLLHENTLWDVFVDIEMKLLPIIADLELTGICVDMDVLKSMESKLLANMQHVEAECYKAAGKSFQINSTQQVRGILYDDLQLDTRTNVRIRETLTKGAKSTAEIMLKSLVPLHPLPALILEYRRLHKAYATFLAGITPHVKNGVVRPVWVQNAAATGRIACNNPNLQAIPKGPFSLGAHPGSQEKPGDETEACSGAEGAECAEGAEGAAGAVCLRDVYVARAGCVLLAADFRQAECRVFARAAADAALQRALQHPDLFRVLAALWLQKAEAEVSAEDRERTKRIVYASMYGAGTHKLMDILGVDYQRALAVTASFNRTFPSLCAFGRETFARVQAGGGSVRTLCGRARRLPHALSADAARRAHAQRQAVNFIVQGTAADLCKLAMVRTVERLRREAVPARLLLTIHDELVWETPVEHLPVAARLVKEAMESCGSRAGLGALPVALSAGRAWGRLQPYDVSDGPIHTH